MKCGPMHGLDCDARCAAAALPEREELMSSRVGRGELARPKPQIRSTIRNRTPIAIGEGKMI